jgi:hypothetical protein
MSSMGNMNAKAQADAIVDAALTTYLSRLVNDVALCLVYSDTTELRIRYAIARTLDMVLERIVTEVVQAKGLLEHDDNFTAINKELGAEDSSNDPCATSISDEELIDYITGQLATLKPDADRDAFIRANMKHPLWKESLRREMAAVRQAEADNRLHQRMMAMADRLENMRQVSKKFDAPPANVSTDKPPQAPIQAPGETITVKLNGHSLTVPRRDGRYAVSCGEIALSAINQFRSAFNQFSPVGPLTVYACFHRQGPVVKPVDANEMVVLTEESELTCVVHPT